MNAIWIIDDDKSIRWVLEKTLAQAGLPYRSFAQAEPALVALEHETPSLILSDIRMPGMNGIDFLEQVRQQHPYLPIIIMTAHSDLDSAVAAYQHGAFDYLPKPFDLNNTLQLIERALAHSAEQKHHTSVPPPSQDLIGQAPAMQEVFRAIGRLSQSQITVLITGASGAGKELVAHALHKHSPRADKPFIALNMAALPKDLIEAELFGHEKGAFTGADSLRRGRFEQAQGGTLFLDEIGDMPLDSQTRLLRVLSNNEFYRIGSSQAIKADVRVLAATHQNLEELVKTGKFREDLWHRLNVIHLHLPTLAERRSDIPMLFDHFLYRSAKELGCEAKVLRPDTKDYLSTLPWPGNVRQLENACRWLTVMVAGREIHISDLPPELIGQEHKQATQDWEQAFELWTGQQLKLGSTDLMQQATVKLERILILQALKYCQDRRGEAAALLGLGRNTLTRKIKELGLGHEDDDDLHTL